MKNPEKTLDLSMSDEAPICNGRDTAGRFVLGNGGGPGRPVGSRNKLSEDFLTALADDFAEHGAAAIAAARAADPMGYVRAIVALVPKEAHLDVTHHDYAGALAQLEQRMIDVTPSSEARLL